MKLKKYENKELRKSKIISLVLACVCIISIGTIIYQSYANYQMKATFRIINGKLKMSGGSGDIEFAFYNGDKTLTTMPTKNNEEDLVFIKATCTNDAVIKWNDDDWDNIVVNNLKKTKTSCGLYFGNIVQKICTLAGEDSGACYLAKQSETDTTNLAYDDTDDRNLRYIGATPYNYVYFNCEDGVEASKETCETWRIIGVMNNIEAEDGNIGSYLKIIRDKFEKNYSWDSSYSENNGYGINEWSQADIEKVLNDEYLYRRTGTNPCYKDADYSTEACPDWTNIGIGESSRNMIVSVKWNIGTMSVDYFNNPNLITASYMYEAERSSHNGKEVCVANGGGKYCNDNVTRTTTWPGKVGLMYPSDYGYAVGGDARTTCLEKSMSQYYNDQCMTNDWLYDVRNQQWTITPVSFATNAYSVFRAHSTGLVTYDYASGANAVRPTLYLKSNVKIALNDAEDYGSVDNPFVLEYSEN